MALLKVVPLYTVDLNTNIIYRKMNISSNAALILTTYNKQLYNCVYDRQHRPP